MIKLTAALMAVLVIAIIGMIANHATSQRGEIRRMSNAPAIWEYMRTMAYDPESEETDIGRGWMR